MRGITGVMARRSRKPYHHGDLRRGLLDATLDLAREKSPAGVSLREAATLAGVSQAAPYRHFADKQAMLAAAAEEGFRQLLERVERLGLAERTPAERLLDWVELYVRFAVEQPAHFRLMHGQGSPPKSASPTLQAAARDTFQAFFRTVSGVTAPWRLDETAQREVALELWSIAHGMAMLALDQQTLFLGIPIDRVHTLAVRAAKAYLDGFDARRRR